MLYVNSDEFSCDDYSEKSTIKATTSKKTTKEIEGVAKKKVSQNTRKNAKLAPNKLSSV